MALQYMEIPSLALRRLHLTKFFFTKISLKTFKKWSVLLTIIWTLLSFADNNWRND